MTDDVAGLCAELRSADFGWSGDACCVSQEVAERAAAILEQQANALREMEATLARVARVDNSLAKQLSESIATNAGLASERDTLRARLKEAEKVLEPFAELAGELSKGNFSTEPDGTPTWSFNGALLTHGHLRAARAFNQGGK